MYHAPTELTDALRAAAASGVRIVAGGTDVYPALRQGETLDEVLDVTRIGGLRGIDHGATGTRIGGAVTWTEIARAALPPAFEALRNAAREVGGVQIQNAGTIAGNLCNASPAADGAPPLLALDASVELVSAERGARVLPLADFLLGARRTARAADEVMTAVLIPPQPEGMRAAFEKLGARRYLVISIAMTAAMIALDEAGAIAEARVAVGACSPVAQRLRALEADLVGRRAGEVRIAPEHLVGLTPIDDARGTAAYRADAVAEQIRRAIRRAAGDE